jgi:hypothetical protein
MWNVSTIKGWIMEIALVMQEVTLGRMAKASPCKNALIPGADPGPSGAVAARTFTKLCMMQERNKTQSSDGKIAGCDCV